MQRSRCQLLCWSNWCRHKIRSRACNKQMIHTSFLASRCNLCCCCASCSFKSATSAVSVRTCSCSLHHCRRARSHQSHERKPCQTECNKYRIPLCQDSHVLKNALFCCVKVRLIVRKLFPCSPPAAGRTAAFPFSILHFLCSVATCSEKKKCNEEKK